MNDLISRQDAIEVLRNRWLKTRNYDGIGEDIAEECEIYLKTLPSAHPDNQINLCDSCEYDYPDCPSKPDDVIFGNGKGNDNICACNKYKPSAQPERPKDIIQNFHDYQVEWLKSHCDIELEPELEMLIVRFLNDTANCYIMEIERQTG